MLALLSGVAASSALAQPQRSLLDATGPLLSDPTTEVVTLSDPVIGPAGTVFWWRRLETPDASLTSVVRRSADGTIAEAAREGTEIVGVTDGVFGALSGVYADDVAGFAITSAVTVFEGPPLNRPFDTVVSHVAQPDTGASFVVLSTEPPETSELATMVRTAAGVTVVRAVDGSDLRSDVGGSGLASILMAGEVLGTEMIAHIDPPTVRTDGAIATRVRYESDAESHAMLRIAADTTDVLTERGDVAPGVPDRTIARLGALPAIDDLGTVSLWARLADDMGSLTEQVIYTTRSGVLAPLVTTGDAAPGTNGEPFLNLLPAIQGNSAGDLLFRAKIGGPADRNAGIWLAPHDGDVTPVLLEGDAVDDGIVRTLGPAHLTEDGSVLMTVTFVPPEGQFIGDQALVLIDAVRPTVLLRSGELIGTDVPEQTVREIRLDGGDKALVNSAIRATGRGTELRAIAGVLRQDRSTALIDILAGCAADIDADGQAGITDLLLYLDAFFRESAPGAEPDEADFNSDGIVDLIDLLEIVDQWLEGC